MNAVAQNARVALAQTRASLLAMSQYRVSTAFWAAASIVQTVVYLAVWRVVGQESGGTDGYDARDFAGYFVALLLVRELTYSWVPYEFPDRVRSGKLAPLLLRPGHPLADMFGAQLAVRINHVVLLIPTAALLFWLFDARIDTGVWNVLAGFVVIPLAGLVRFLVDSLVSLSSMWLVRIEGIVTLYYLAMIFLSGQFAPIAVLPDPLRVVAKVLPFYWTLGYPVELLVGRAEPGDAWIGLLVLSGWTLVLIAVLRPVWRAGTRAFEAVGQ